MASLRAGSLYFRSVHSLCTKASQRDVFYRSTKVNFPSLGSVHFMSTQQFEEAKARLGKLSEDPGNEAKLKIYGLFKQATEGPVTTKRPGMMDFVARAKWDAWKSNGDISKEDAQQKYIDVVNSLVKSEESDSAAQDSSQKFKHLLIECDGGLRKIILNRPKKMNALTFDMYGEWVEALQDAENDPKTVITAVTGSGSYYCSGNDLSNFTGVNPDNMSKMATEGSKILKKFVGSFIDFKKPLVAVLNGPAVGVSVTILGLFDGVYSTDKATLHTPFSALGQSPEGCSSVTFPRVMGYANSAQLLFFNKKVTAQEAQAMGLVTEVLPDSVFQSEIWARLKEHSKLPLKSLVYSKELVRAVDRDALHKANQMECDRLEERWLSDDCINAVMAFFSKKKA